MIRRLLDWWSRQGWQPDPRETAAKDRQAEALRTDAILARIGREQATVIVNARLRVMRESFARADERLARRK